MPASGALSASATAAVAQQTAANACRRLPRHAWRILAGLRAGLNGHGLQTGSQLVRVGLPPSSHTVLHVYTPQWKSTVAEFVEELSDVIASINANSTDNLVVCGDVNCPGPTPSSVDVALTEMLDSLGLTQLVGLLRVAAEVILCAV